MSRSKRQSQAKKLRDLLYLLWVKEKSKLEFDDYYHKNMSRIINHFKEKIKKIK